MGLEVNAKLSNSDDCSAIHIYELTGEYSDQNTTGYGTPNPTVNDVTTVEITVTNPSGASYTITDATGTILTAKQNKDAYIDWTAVVYADDPLETSAVPEDGIWTLTYTVSGTTPSAFSSTITKKFAITCDIECCIDKLIALVDPASCDKCSSDLELIATAKAYLYAVHTAVECEQFETAKKLIKKLQFICSSKKCACK